MGLSKRELNWQNNYFQLKKYIEEHHHLPDKRTMENRGLLNWWKYNRKLVLQGKLDEMRVHMLEQLGQMRDL